MAPKFRGNSDDWLDDESARNRGKSGMKPKKGPAARSAGLPLDQANATVAEVFPKQCRVWLDSGPLQLCAYRRAGIIGASNKTEARERTPVAVGDRVKVGTAGSEAGIVEGLCERRNRLLRPAPGREGQVHVIAANVDILVVVASIASPEFSPGLVDRFLVAANAAGIDSLICVTKIDLRESASPPVEGEHDWRIYPGLGIDLVEVSSRRGDGIDELRSRLAGRTVVFCGKSGVGKTSLLRALIGSDFGKVAEVSAATGKGRHTTTSAVLLGGPEGSRWIDTPGVREFGLVDATSETLAESFPEFRSLPCAHPGCRHLDEEGCEARGLVRYPSYRRILVSLLEGTG